MAWGNVDEVQEDGDLDFWSSGPSEAENEAPDDQAMDDSNDDNEAAGYLPDDESDSDADTPHAHAPRTSDEKRRAQNAIFSAFVTKKTNQITEQEIKGSDKELSDDQLSIRELMANQGNSAKITNPRDYQTELFQRAKDENIIAVLGTGSGKTHIATLLLRHIIDLELEARAKGASPKIAFFLVRIGSLSTKALL